MKRPTATLFTVGHIGILLLFELYMLFITLTSKAYTCNGAAMTSNTSPTTAVIISAAVALIIAVTLYAYLKRPKHAPLVCLGIFLLDIGLAYLGFGAVFVSAFGSLCLTF